MEVRRQKGVKPARFVAGALRPRAHFVENIMGVPSLREAVALLARNRDLPRQTAVVETGQPMITAALGSRTVTLSYPTERRVVMNVRSDRRSRRTARQLRRWMERAHRREAGRSSSCECSFPRCRRSTRSPSRGDEIHARGVHRGHRHLRGHAARDGAPAAAKDAAILVIVSDQRKISEEQFYDRAYESGTVDTKNGFFEISAGVQRYRQLIFDGCAGKRILEYGCGLGGQAFALADRGAIVTGIDISDVAVAQARRRATAYPQQQLRFVKADAEALEFPDGSFDVVCGSGILHHLHLGKALREVRRVLVAGGRGIFYEPLGHNPLLNLYRKLTPREHTPDEHPLVMCEVRDFDRKEFFDLLSVFVIPVLRWPGGESLLRAAEWADRVIFRIVPPLRAMAAVVVLELRK